MPMQRRTLLLSVIALSILFSCVYFLLQNINTLSPLGRIKNAQEVAKLSGEYAFRSEIAQITNLSPNTSNYGKQSRQETFVVEGAVNESQQTSNLTISNTQGVLMEVKRERGVTYMRQAGGAWQQSTSSGGASQLNSLSFLAGVSNATRDMSDTQRYTFDFDGAKFSDHFARLLSADAAHGIAHNQEWTDIANSAQYRLSQGDGKIVIDNDGLPQSIEMRIAMPGDKKQGSSDTRIATTFFNYARTGLALQKLAHNPFYMLSNLVGSDVSTVRSLLLGCIAVLLLIVGVSVLFAMRRKLYVPLAIFVIGIMLFQPFSSIPRTRAASQTPPIAPGTPSSPTTPPEPVFNPLVAPFNQGAGITLPAAGTSTAPGMVVGTSTTQRLVRDVSTTNSNAVDTDKDGLSDNEETQYGTDPLLADSDGDGLSDSQEISIGTNPLLADEDEDGLNDSAELQVGTDHTLADSDYDGLADFAEVTTFTQYAGSNNTFYSNPLDPDTNGDGINDGQECFAKQYSPAALCSDSDGNGVPDFLSFDNDGDKVPDTIDISPDMLSTVTYTKENPFNFKITNTTTSTVPLEVNIQIRPNNDNLLYANDAVYDWPSGDTQGQVQRGKDSTYATSNLFNATDTKSTNGDVKITALLEVRVPLNNGSFGNLPVAPCNTTNTCPTQTNYPNWLDKTKLDSYGISVAWSKDDKGNILNGNNGLTEVTLGVPLLADYDKSGTITAYSAALQYQTSQIIWSTNHSVRLQWIVTSIQDACPADKQDCAVSERIETNAPLQVYYGNWNLIGISATENKGVKTAIIYEDSTQSVITNPIKRRLNITKIKALLSTGFLKHPFYSIDGTDVNKSISQVFDNTKNATAQTGNNFDPFATKVATFSYPNDGGLQDLFTNRLPTILNNTLCKANGASDNCANQQTLRTSCETLTSVACRPAALVLTEKTTRTTSLNQFNPDSNNIDFANVETSVLRTMQGQIYKIVSGRWEVANDNDIQTEVNFALQAKTNEATPDNLSDNDWNNWRFGMISSIILDFQHTESKGYLLKTTPLLTYGITPASFNTTATDSWGYYIKDTYTYFSSVLDDTSELSPKKKNTSLQQKLKDSIKNFFNQDPNSVPLGKKPNYVQVLRYTRTIAKAVAKLDEMYYQNPKMDGTLKFVGSASKYIGMGLVMFADVGLFKTDTQKLAATITGQTLQLFSATNDVVHISIEIYEAYKATQVAKALPVAEAVMNNIDNVSAIEGALYYTLAFAEDFFKIAGSLVLRMIPFYDTYKLMATMGWTKAIEVGERFVAAVTVEMGYARLAIEFISHEISQINIVKNIGKVISDIKVMAAGKEFGRLCSKMGTILVAAMIAMVWVLGIMQAVKAEYGYQKANIIGNLIGQTATMIVLVAIASTGVGALIAAIVALLDIISMIACKYLSDKQIRSTAGQWLCGGISGIAAKFLSPYAASIVIDPNDPFSRYQNITGGGGLSRNIDGFSTGNSYRKTLAVTDYIQKMPFPAQWQSAFFAWQWKNLDERETSFVYTLNNQQIDMRGSAVRGAQFSDWQANSASNTDYYSDGDKSYKWKKTFNVEYTTPLTTSGINVQMSDLWLSEAFKVPQQTCISIPNPIIFWPLIPICWIETLNGNPKYTNINETDKTIFDVFPATIDEFVSLRQKNNGYTFAWTDDTVQPTFPVFGDADNDGVPNSSELISNTFDNDWDSDNDGISDYSEINVTYSKPNGIDSDNDGLNDSQEIFYGTNQLMPDTDGDGLLDGEEVVHVDANGNMVGGWQVTYAIVAGLPQTTWTGSDPTTADGDDDGITDLREKVLGWSPYAKNSAELIGLAGDVREAIIPIVQSTFEPINPTSFSNTGYSGSMITCADVASCPVTTSSGARLANTTSLQFDGNDKLDAGSGPQATFDSQFTLSLWVKPTYQSAPHTIFVQPGHIGVFRTVQGNVEVKLSTNAPNGPTSGADWTYQQTTDAVLPVNTWTNLVVTYANNTVIVYINGSESSRFFTSGMLFDKSTGTNNLNIGGSYINSGTTRYSGMLGMLDDMSIYRIALSAKEVSLIAQDKLENANNDLIVRPGDRIYSNITTSNKLLGRSMQGYTTVTAQSAKNDYQASQMTALGLPANTSAAIENIIEVPGALNPVTATNSYVNSCVFPRTELCVKLDETNTTFPLKFSDVSPNQSVLTCSNTAACPSSVASNWKFTSNTDISTTASVGNAISSRDFTVSLWVKPEDQSVTNRTIVMSKNSNAVLKLALANEYPQFTIGSTTLASSTALAIGQWHHLVFRSLLGKRQIFVDGVNVASDTTVYSYPSSAFGELRIGKDAATNSLMGSLRDIQINSLALSDNDIAALARTCEDPRLIACMPFTGSTTAAQSIDYSRYGIDQGVALNCSGCTTSNNSEISFNSSTTASLPNGYASLINDHDFSIMLKVKLASVAGTQTILQSSVITGTGNQLLLQVVNGRPTVVRKNVVAGATTSSDSASLDNLTMSAGTWYILTAKQSDGRLSMTAYAANGSALQSASKEIASTALTQAQEPLTLGTTGLSVDLLRMYRTGLTSANMEALARYALFGNLSINLNQAPQSDSMPITVEARTKIIVPDANFERIRGNCDESSAVLCVPFDRDMNTAYPDPMANATVIQSSTAIGWPAQYAMDKNFGTMNHTNVDTNAKLFFDLGQVRDIATVTIYDRADCCQTRSDSAKVFVSTTPSILLETPENLIAKGTTWKNMKCDNQNQTQVCASKNVFDVTFPKGTRGRYVYITVANNPLHFREVVVNSTSDIQSCNRTNTCPTFNAGGNEFVSANKQSIALSANLSQTTFNGTKNYTVMSWIKLKDPMAKNVIIGDNSGIADGVNNTDSNFRIEGGILRVGPTTCTDCTYYLSDGVTPTTAPGWDRPLSANTWYHAALVRSGTTQTIYLNGVRYMSKATAYTFNNVRQMEIGGASGQLNGSLRDFQIHGTALTISQIKLSASSPAFELRMPMDEPALSTAFSDVITTGLQLECVAACPLSGVPGRDNRAVRFSGNQPLLLGNAANAFASYLKVVDTNSNLPQKTFSLSMWVKPTKYGVWLLGNDTINQMMRLGIDANGFVSYEHAYACYNAFCWPKAPLRSATKLPLNTWSHINVTQYPESGGNCGINYSTAAISINGIYSNSGLTIPVRMCSMTYADTNMPVTASSSANTIINSAGQTSPQLANLNNYSSTSPKPPATITDQNKQGWTFIPETNQGITFGDSGRLTNSNAATIAFWVKPLGLTGDERLLTREGQYYFRLVNNRLYFAFYTQYSGWTDYDTTFTLTTNTWQHVALTYDGPSGNCNNTCNSLVIRAGTQSKIFQLQGAILSLSNYETTPLTTGYTVANKGLEHNFSIANIFVTPRKLSDTELAALQNETFTTDNLRKYGNVDPANSTLNIGETFVGDMDEFRISPVVNANYDQTQVKQAPNWNLSFEDTLSSSQTKVTNGLTVTTPINSVVLPDDVPGRAGIGRFNYAANCTNPDISGANCPVADTLGMEGMASTFNGQDTLLQVNNATAIINDIKNGGTVRLMIHPDKTIGNQTVLYYGDSAGTTIPLRVRLVADKVEIKIGSQVFMSTTSLPIAWNQIAFRFGSNGFRYYQNGTLDTGTSATTDSAVTLTSDASYKLRIGGVGKIAGVFSEMFDGSIDEISLTPTESDDAKIYRIARAQFAQAITKSKVAELTIDADAPIITITNPQYTSRIPIQFSVKTSDLTSSVQKVTTAITSTLSATGSIIAASTTEIPSAACTDTMGGTNYCPTFQVNQTATIPVEGKYGIVVTAADAVNNTSTQKSLIYVDTTAPNASLIRNSGTYTTSRTLDQNSHHLMLRFTVSDPCIGYTSCSVAGSGVASVSVNVKESGGRTINQLPIPATLRNGAWVADVALPFGDPSGFYQISAITTDNVGNRKEVIVASENSPIEVDNTPPQDVIASPSPYDANTYFIGNQALTGRVSDYVDGRAAIHQGMRVRLDFEAPDGASVFDNRGDSRYNTSCTICPTVALDTTDASKRVARFNIEGINQSLTIANAATVLSGTFGIALMVKITNAGTILSTGIASNPRLRIKAEKVGTTFKITAQRGTKALSTPATMNTNDWYYLIYSEDGTTMSLQYGTQLKTMPAALTLSTTGTTTPLLNDIIIGAVQSNATTTAKEDYFSGYLDDIVVSGFPLTNIDLLGTPISQGSGVQAVTGHQVRLNIMDDGYTGSDQLAALAGYYLPVNQSTYPLLDSISGTQSSRCMTTGVFLGTCPQLIDGFASNAITFNKTTDGIQTGYSLQSSGVVSHSLALRFKINPDATSGLLASLQAPTTAASLAMQVLYQKDTQSLAIRINNSTSTLLSTSATTTPIDDNNWHTLIITSRGTNSTTKQITISIDGNLTLTQSITGNWVGAQLGLGAMTVTPYTGTSTTTTAATNTIVDDVAVFNTVLSRADMRNYSYGYSTVYHETFDNPSLTPNSTIVENSPFNQSSNVLSSDTTLTSLVGNVGSGALRFDGNDEIVHRDTNAITFADANSPWSIATWITPAQTQSATIASGNANGFIYQLTLDSGRPKFSNGTMTITAPSAISTTSASLVVVSNDGSTTRMYVNGSMVASATTSGTTVPAATNAQVQFTSFKMCKSCSPTSSNAAYDNNMATSWAGQLSLNNTNLEATADNVNTIDRIAIYNTNTFSPLRNFYVFVYDATLTDDSINALKANAKWFYYNPGSVTDHIIIPVPYGVKAKKVRIVKLGNGETLALNEVKVLQLPQIRVGTGFVGVIDDLRIYRRALTTVDIARLQAMAWRPSTLSARYDGYSWQQPAFTNIEANTSIQSMTVDVNGNSRRSSGEKALWNGMIDTLSPSISVSGTSTNYAVAINDRNLIPTQINTPCGSKLQLSNQPANSLWFLSRMSFLDGTVSPITGVNGTCTLSSSPELIQTNSQNISTTTSLAFGKDVAYVGINNTLRVVSAQSQTTMLGDSTPVNGTVILVNTNRTKTRLYTISRIVSGASTQTILSLYDIATNSKKPALLSSLPITVAPNANVTQMGIANNGNGDTFVVLVDSLTPATIMTVNVANVSQPTRSADTTALFDNTYGLAVQDDLVVLAHGADGVSVNRIDNVGSLDSIARYQTQAYVNNLFFSGKNLLLVDDEEPLDSVTPIQSTNTLRVIPLIDTIVAGSANINGTLSEASNYTHLTRQAPFGSDDFASYRIQDVATYIDNSVLILSGNPESSTDQRISMVRIADNSAKLLSDTRISTPNLAKIATNNQFVVALGNNTTSLVGMQISDARLDTSACDIVNNCTTIPSSYPATLALGQTPPVQASVRILNQVRTYAAANPTIYVSAEAPTGVKNISMTANGTAVGTPWVAGSVNPLAMETAFPLVLGTGVHTIVVSMTAGNSVVTTTSMTVIINTNTPTVAFTTQTFGLNQLVNGNLIINATINDGLTTGNDLYRIQVIDNSTNTFVPYTIKPRQGTSIPISILYRSNGGNTTSIPLTLIVTDGAGRTTNTTATITFDSTPPIVTNPIITAKLNGATTATTLQNGQLVTPTTDVATDLHVEWSAINDQSPIIRNQIEYLVKTVTGITAQPVVAATVPANTSTIAAGRLPAVGTGLPLTEASRMDLVLHLTDGVQNDTYQPLSSVYIDKDTTPDYTLMDDSPIYRGFLNTRCTILDTDTRATANGNQQFAVTWDSQAVRFNWQGADWNYNGNLFIYLDSIANAGTTKAYRPPSYTKTITESLASGESFITLPINTAARTVTTNTLTNPSHALGSDYVIHVQNRTTINLLRWDSTAGTWVTENTIPEYRYTVDAGINQTDIRLLFSQISYTATNPIGVVAFATNPTVFAPWAAFPTTNPVSNSQSDSQIAITPLTSGYGWATLGSNVCPKTTRIAPISSQITAAITSAPVGVYKRTITDIYPNTEPDSIKHAIAESADMCGVLTSNPWCVAASSVQNNTNNSVAIIRTLANQLTLSNAPVAGSGQNVSYTFTIKNSTTSATRPLYALVETYGDVWLTDGNTAATTPAPIVSIVAGGNYSYHSISNAGLRDYQVIKINAIPANTEQQIVLNGLIDNNKAHASTADRLRSQGIAKITVRISDTATPNATTITGIDANRIVETINAVQLIDTAAPSQIVADNQQSIKRGNTSLTGKVTDASPVTAVTMEYTTSNNSSAQTINCGAAINSRWQCPITIATNISSISYRLRASDTYNQQSDWSAWYTAGIDQTPPTFNFNTITTNLLASTYVGGSNITVGGTVTDNNNQADISLCDSQNDACELAIVSNPTTVNTTYTPAATPNSAIAVGVCSETEFADYSRFGLSQTTANASARVQSIAVTVNATSAASQKITLWLQSPSGTRIPLLTSNRTSTTTNLNAQFTDSTTIATTTLGNATSGSPVQVRADGTLGTIAGEPVNGTWLLLACDNGGSSASTLTQWGLTITSTTSPTSNNAPWSYALKNTANQDGVIRNLTMWAVDKAKNTSAPREFTLRVDTVAPELTIAQVNTTALASSQITMLQGTISDGGNINPATLSSPLTAVVYSGSRVVRTDAIIMTALPLSQTVQRINYLTNRTFAGYSWQYQFNSTNLSAGDYTVQLTAQDGAGNRRISNSYVVTVPQTTQPALNNVAQMATNSNDSATFNYQVDTGKGETTINTTVQLEKSTAPESETIADSSTIAWGTPDIQQYIPASVQGVFLKQLGMNEASAVALDNTGTMTTWAWGSAYSSQYTFGNLQPLKNVRQFAIGADVNDPHLLVLSNTGIITDFTSSAATTIVSPTQAVSIAAGKSHYLAVLKSGKLTAWGTNTNGESTIPVAAQMGVSQIGAGNNFSVALTNNGRVIAWGNNDYGQTTVPVSATNQIAQIAVGDQHVLALRQDGQVISWGRNNLNQTQLPSICLNTDSPCTQFYKFNDVVAITAYRSISVAISRSGAIYMWGQRTINGNWCCYGANLIAGGFTGGITTNYSPIITNHMSSIQVNTTIIQASDNTIPKTVTFTNLIPYRRYKYTMTVTNSAGSRTYNGTFDTTQSYNQLFVPLLSNANPLPNNQPLSSTTVVGK